MIKYLFSLLLLFHGWIHLIGFAKAVNLATSLSLKKKVSLPFGILWLIIGLLFVYLALAFLGREDWYIPAFTVVTLSQLLIFIFWQDAKAASIMNLLVFSVALVQYAEDKTEYQYKQDVMKNFQESKLEDELVTEEELTRLPAPVAKYLMYVGVVGHPKIKSTNVEMSGEMRRREGMWFRFDASQHSFFQEPSRFFFMKAKVSSLPAIGYHAYSQNEAHMQVKMMALFPVVDLEGEMLFKAETVTFLNDLCIFAPAALIDERITWKAVNDTVSEVTFTNQDVSVSAMLHFNKKGQLTNFISEDRYDISDMKNYRFSTPVSNYENVNGFNLPTYGETIWHYPDGAFVYGKFNIKEVKYNQVKEDVLRITNWL